MDQGRGTKKVQGKNLGTLGQRGFKSNSMETWKKEYEKGEAGHSFASFGFHEDVP
jgi:hypothetical protein